MPTVNEQWKRENTKSWLLRFTKNSGVLDALQKMEAETGETQKEYIRRSVVEALIADGYLEQK